VKSHRKCQKLGRSNVGPFVKLSMAIELSLIALPDQCDSGKFTHVYTLRGGHRGDTRSRAGDACRCSILNFESGVCCRQLRRGKVLRGQLTAGLCCVEKLPESSLRFLIPELRLGCRQPSAWQRHVTRLCSMFIMYRVVIVQSTPHSISRSCQPMLVDH
jgi:hypothetical protein